MLTDKQTETQTDTQTASPDEVPLELKILELKDSAQN